jgi:hypothetical protein
LAIVLLVVPLVLACIVALKGQPAQQPIASLPAARETHPVKAAPTLTPAQAPMRPIVQPDTTARTVPRQVYVKAVLTPIPPDPTPIPAAIKTPPALPPALNPILQVPEAKRPIFKRLDERSEFDLIHDLSEITKEVDLESVKGTREKLLAEARTEKDGKKVPILALRAQRPDLKGLPMQEGVDCQASCPAVKRMQEISTTLRRELDRQGVPASTASHSDFYRGQRIQSRLRSSENWFQEDGLSTLGQMLQVEDMDTRSDFLKRLAQVKVAKASLLLARQALFDFSWTTREEAIKALKDRPREEYRQVLLDGLRYPWPPVAAHAAEALVALKDREAIFQLADLIDEPDPCAPIRDNNDKWVVAEIVRVNHSRNCLLCHAVSTAPSDPLRGVVPTPGQPLPRVYYNSRKGDFVRADITYLRQDFSLIERVLKPERWPEWQRFDYLVRKRELKVDELAALQKKPPRSADRISYPQREAVRFALRELTGLDAGESSAEWYESLCALESLAPH